MASKPMTKNRTELLGISDYLTVRKAAEFLGVSVSTLRNWDRQGKLKPVRNPLNGYRLYRLSDLEAVLAMIGRKANP